MHLWAVSVCVKCRTVRYAEQQQVIIVIRTDIFRPFQVY